ncbi:MAG TPA: acyl-CoA dehydrogenase family protein [Myxococcota bacterium]|nr:acyl-CoA dehydrogenase family protein [Myxococcota bacterium]
MPADFVFTDEHHELRKTVRAFLEKRSDEKAVRALMASARGYDPEVWKQLAEELGLAGLIIPEEHGGAGFGPIELLIAMEEMGRALLCAPFLGTSVCAARALLECADGVTQKELLAKIAAGAAVVSVAHAEPNGRWDLAGITLRAKGVGPSVTLDGEKTLLLDGHVADVLLVVARGDAGLELLRVDAGAAGLTRESIPALDLTRKLARVRFSRTPATRVSSGDQTANLERVLAFTCAALAAEQVGGAQKCLELATDYAKSRLQFGRPIGSYQGIKHKCAEMLVAVEMAKSAAYNALFIAAANEPDFVEAAHLAKAYCSEAYFHAAADNIQIHGGMGFTWEASPHLYFKRAKASDLLFGDAAHHREELAKHVGL